MQKFFLGTLLAIAALVLNSCDIIEGDKVCYDCLAEGSGKKVLVEEFTGQRCPNCPSAARELHTLDSIYGEDLIIVGIHAGYFAQPVVGLGYTADYRTPIGADLSAAYDAETFGYPCGLISRQNLLPSAQSATGLARFADWGTIIPQIMAQTPHLSMAVENTYDSTTRNLDVRVSMDFFEPGTANYQLMVLVTEDSIVSKQLDGLDPVDDYVHRHVLRTTLTGTWGLPVSTTPINAGDLITKTVSVTLDSTWKAEHCAVVAYVTTAPSMGSQVLQAEEAHVIH